MDERAYVSRTNGDRTANLDAIRSVFAQAREALAPLAVEEFRYQKRRGCSDDPSFRETREALQRFCAQLVEDLDFDVYDASRAPGFRLFPEEGAR